MKLSTKIIAGIIFFLVALLTWGSWDIRQNNIKSIASGMGTSANAGLLDDITAAVGGHISDVIDRSKDDEFIPGNTITKSEFTLSKDSIHWAEGGVSLVYDKGLTYIQLEPDFEAGLAPDLYIFTSKDRIDSQSALNRTEKLNLTKLKKGSGASYYLLDDVEDIKSIVIWCKRFNQWMGSAIIK